MATGVQYAWPHDLNACRLRIRRRWRALATAYHDSLLGPCWGCSCCCCCMLYVLVVYQTWHMARSKRHAAPVHCPPLTAKYRPGHPVSSSDILRTPQFDIHNSSPAMAKYMRVPFLSASLSAPSPAIAALDTMRSRHTSSPELAVPLTTACSAERGQKADIESRRSVVW